MKHNTRYMDSFSNFKIDKDTSPVLGRIEQHFYEQDHYGKTVNLRSSYKRHNEPIEKYHKER